VRTKFLAGFVTAGFLLTPCIFAADQERKKSKENDEVAQAIAFERHKEAAAARQARIEAKHPTVTYSNSEAERSADQDKSKADSSSDKGSKKQEQRD
jgi:hypothetical protein